MALDDKKLENSLNKLGEETHKETKIEMSVEEEIGFHKGCLNTLLAERNELVKIIGTVEAIMQSHIKRLEQLGVKFRKE